MDWDTVGRLGIDQAEAIIDYLSENPPLHLMIKSFLGYEGKTAAVEESREATDAEAAQFFRAVNGGM
jgi:hypothetical protein